MKALFSRYVDATIGINYRRPYHVEGATLTAATESYFSVRGLADGTLHTFPYTNVIQVMENESGVTAGGLFQHKETFPMLVKVGHVIDPTPVA